MPFYTKRFDDIKLMLGGISIMILGQLLYFSYWGAEPSSGRFICCVIFFYAFGYPIGHTAVLGAFSKVQKSGPQVVFIFIFIFISIYYVTGCF